MSRKKKPYAFAKASPQKSPIRFAFTQEEGVPVIYGGARAGGMSYLAYEPLGIPTQYSCYTCGSTNWSAANEDYCTNCECDWYQALSMVLTIDGKENPLQAMADDILSNYQLS